MTIFIAADHRGYEMKNALRDWLVQQGYEVIDLGADALDDSDDYPDFAVKVARAVAEDPEQRRGIGICGSGVGMAVVAGKVKGVRASLIHDPAVAEAARQDDDINFLALGADFISLEHAKKVTQLVLTTRFSNGDRHQRRLKKIKTYEHEHSCPCRPSSAAA